MASIVLSTLNARYMHAVQANGAALRAWHTLPAAEHTKLRSFVMNFVLERHMAMERYVTNALLTTAAASPGESGSGKVR